MNRTLFEVMREWDVADADVRRLSATGETHAYRRALARRRNLWDESVRIRLSSRPIAA